jgi:hypothetical protein
MVGVVVRGRTKAYHVHNMFTSAKNRQIGNSTVLDVKNTRGTRETPENIG